MERLGLFREDTQVWNKQKMKLRGQLMNSGLPGKEPLNCCVFVTQDFVTLCYIMFMFCIEIRWRWREWKTFCRSSTTTCKASVSLYSGCYIYQSLCMQNFMQYFLNSWNLCFDAERLYRSAPFKDKKNDWFLGLLVDFVLHVWLDK